MSSSTDLGSEGVSFSALFLLSLSRLERVRLKIAFVCLNLDLLRFQIVKVVDELEGFL